MAKGQLRKWKEKKKPKQDKVKTAAPASPFSATQAKANSPAEGKK